MSNISATIAPPSDKVVAEFLVPLSNTAGMLQAWNRAVAAGALSIELSEEPDCLRFVVQPGFAEFRCGNWVPKAPLLPTLSFPHWMDSPSVA